MTRRSLLILPLLLAASLAQTTAPAERTLTGTVVDEAGHPAPNATISCEYGLIHTTATAGRDGSFTLAFPAISSFPFPVPLIASTPNQATLAYQFYAPPTADHPAPPARLTLRPARQLAVTVSGADHQPIANAAIVAGRPAVPIARATSDAAGKATLLLPADAPIEFIIASKSAAGFDYIAFPTAEGHPPPATLPAAVAFTLAAAPPLTVHIVDDDNRPITGATVHPTYINFTDKPLFFPSLLDLTRTTDAAGNAAIDFLPASATQVLLTASVDAHTTAQAPFDPAHAGKPLTITLFRQVPLTGHVRDANGRGVAGATVSASGNDGGNFPVGMTATAAADGSFSLLLDPDKYYLFVATKDSAISSPVTALIRRQPPKEPLDLTLGDGVHLRGHLTAGPGNAPVPNTAVVIDYEDASYARLPADQQLPPIPGNTNPLVLSFSQIVTTDKDGVYDAITLPGPHVLFATIGTQRVLKQVPVEPRGATADLHSTVPLDAPKSFSGRIVRADNPDTPVPNALLESALFAANIINVDPFDPAAADGTFTEKHVPVDFYLAARSPDGKLAAIVRLTPKDDNVLIPLAPAATLTARLVDADKTPVPHVTLYLSFPRQPHDKLTRGYLRTTTTDANGNFAFDGLIPGYAYPLEILDGQRMLKTLTTITPKKPGDLPLGDVTPK